MRFKEASGRMDPLVYKARVSRRLLAALFAAIVVTAGVSTAVPTPASAAGPPELTGVHVGGVYSTRAGIVPNGVVNYSNTVVYIEYGTSSKGPWTLACEKLVYANPEGEGDATLEASGCVVHHLKPETHYYARAQAVNEYGSSGEATAEFTTKPVGPPEIEKFGTTEDSGDARVGVHYVEVHGEVETNGAESKYRFEYAESQTGTWAAAPGCAGSVTVVEDVADPKCRIEGLAPETKYSVRLVAENEKGSVSGELGVETRTAKPMVAESVIADRPTNIGPTSATVHDLVVPNGSETTWRFEYSTSEAGPWVKGPEGVISGSEADERRHRISADLTGLSPSKTYYVRLVAENQFGAAISEFAGGINGGVPRVTSIETGGPPLAFAFATHTFVPGSEAVRVLGSVRQNSEPQDDVQMVSIGGSPTGGTFTLSFEGQTTAPIPFDATEGEVCKALAALSSIGGCEPGVRVSGKDGGPYRIEFADQLGGKAQPALTGDGSGLTPSGSVSVTTIHNGGAAHTHYHVEYVEQGQFEANGWTGTAKTAELDAGSGGIGVQDTGLQVAGGGSIPVPQSVVFSSALVAGDLPVLQSDKSYRYRLVATNEAGTVASAERSLSIPAVRSEGSEGCPNEFVRTGPSALLADCRAYEQVSPVDKEGASEILKYGIGFAANFGIGSDGDHLFFESAGTKWGASPDSYTSHYSFSRGSDGWGMVSATPQPEAGLSSYNALLDSPDLREVGVEIGWLTERVASSKIELAVGPAGGPYKTVASTPRADVPLTNTDVGQAWVAASSDFSKLVLRTEDRKLLGGASTGTASGSDLYEYSKGALRQLNVSGATTIGRCGAVMAMGFEAYDAGLGARAAALASPHSVSADGSRVFFEAVPGSNCSAPAHLYVRVNGEQTVDIGEYTFLAADPSGSKVLVESENVAGEVLLYDTQARSLTQLMTLKEPLQSGRLSGGGHDLTVAENLDAVYFTSESSLTKEAPAPTESHFDLYRYDVAQKELAYVAEIVPQEGGEVSGLSASADGKQFYFMSQGVAGVPGGPGQEDLVPSKAGAYYQAYRYDATTDTIQCVSCASPFNPEPKLQTTFAQGYDSEVRSPNDVPNDMTASANGDYVFFDTTAELVPQDINGETAPEADLKVEHQSYTYSTSSDVYEWRRDGVDGCAHAQGCLSLISSGQGGFYVRLLGTDASGRDVFFTSRSQLAPSDNDSAIDIYDARIGGGFPPPAPAATECGGDACFSPVGAPLDSTPASLSFSGPGNPLLSPPATVKSKGKPKAKPCHGAKCRRKRKKRKTIGRHRKPGRAAHRPVAKHKRGARK